MKRKFDNQFYKIRKLKGLDVKLCKFKEVNALFATDNLINNSGDIVVFLALKISFKEVAWIAR